MKRLNSGQVLLHRSGFDPLRKHGVNVNHIKALNRLLTAIPAKYAHTTYRLNHFVVGAHKR